MKDKPAGDASARSGSVAMAGSEIGVGDGGRFQIGDVIQTNLNDLHDRDPVMANILAAFYRRFDALEEPVNEAMRHWSYARNMMDSQDLYLRTLEEKLGHLAKEVHGNGKPGLDEQVRRIQNELCAVREEVHSIKRVSSVMAIVAALSPLATVLALRLMGGERR